MNRSHRLTAPARLAVRIVAAVLGALLVTGTLDVVPRAAAVTANDVAGPSWWSGDCDAPAWNAKAGAAGWSGAPAHRLGASYLGVPVCGPRPGADGAPDVLWSRPGWGHLEWECTELAFRFMAQVYSVVAYGANGDGVVSNYTPDAGGGLVRVDNSTPGIAPQPGDVMSFTTPFGVGHVAVVSGGAVDASGNGWVMLMSQNDTQDGWRRLAVNGWTVQGFGSYSPYGWLHDPLGRGLGTPSPPSSFHPIAPVRVLDSRDGTGGFDTPWAALTTRTLTIAGMAGVPSDATGVLLNVTGTAPTEPSFATVWPAGEPQPTASNLNWPAGDTRPNLVVAKLGVGGAVSIYNNAGAVNIIGDVVGWFGGTDGDRLTALPPARILDSRDGTGTGATPFGAHETRSLQITGNGGVPTGADGVVLNITVTDGTEPSFLTVWPGGGAMPTASSLNWPAGDTRPNLVAAKLGAGGTLSIYNQFGSVNVVADVVGYFAPSSGALFRSLSPARVLDSRIGTGGYSSPWLPGTERSVAVAGVGGVPPTATAVALNLTVTNTQAASYTTVWPAGVPRPLASNLNFTAGQTVPNLVVVPVGAGGSISIYVNSGVADVVADVVGYAE